MRNKSSDPLKQNKIKAGKIQRLLELENCKYQLSCPGWLLFQFP